MTCLKWLINQVTSEMLSYIRYLSLHNFAPNCIKTQINSCWIRLPSQIWKAKVHPLKKQTKEVCRSCETDWLLIPTDRLFIKQGVHPFKKQRRKKRKRGKMFKKLALQLIFWTFTSGKMDVTHQINISQHRRVITILYADIGQKGSISADAKPIFVCDNDTCLIYSINTDWRTALFFNIRKQK